MRRINSNQIEYASLADRTLTAPKAFSVIVTGCADAVLVNPFDKCLTRAHAAISGSAARGRVGHEPHAGQGLQPGRSPRSDPQSRRAHAAGDRRGDRSTPADRLEHRPATA